VADLQIIPDKESARAELAVALYVNRFHVVAATDVVRIAFGEAVIGTDATYRTAIVMRTSDAIQLLGSLKSMLQQISVLPQTTDNAPNAFDNG
jgi:hypothetical protein